MKVVFVGGIHGVGKSTLCEAFSRTSGLLHVTASSIIRMASEEATRAQGKLVRDVEANQALLVAGVSRLGASGVAEAMLLDGHFTLGKHDGTIERIPTKVFSDLQVSSLVCLQDSPNEIASRLLARDGSVHSVADLSAFQEAELEHAAAVSNELNVPLALVKAFDMAAFEAVMASTLRDA